jgi:succinyl-CoA synthetase alpha subunit
MAIFLTADSKVIVQGITGSEGTKHTRRMVSSGTKVVGGVNPRKAGSDVDGIPVFATVAEAMEATGADVSVIFVPPAFAKAPSSRRSTRRSRSPSSSPRASRCRTAPGSGRTARARPPGSSARTARADQPRQVERRHHPGDDRAEPGRIGLVSKSGTLTYQMMYELREFGFSTAIGIGGDPVIGTTHIDALEAFQADPRPTPSS